VKCTGERPAVITSTNYSAGSRWCCQNCLCRSWHRWADFVQWLSHLVCSRKVLLFR